MREHDFSDDVIGEIAKAAMLLCQNPQCLRFTSYTSSSGKARRIADAAHVIGSGKKGPRAEDARRLKDVNLSSAANGIWLCKICHDRIDRDPSAYPSEGLFAWRETQRELVRSIVGLDVESALIRLGQFKRYNDVLRDFLSFLDSRRMLYEQLDVEFPSRVLDSIEMIRARIIRDRALIGADNDLSAVLQALQSAVDVFLRDTGSDTDLRELKCNSGDPAWLRFADALLVFRQKTVSLVQLLAVRADYKLQHVGLYGASGSE